MAPIVHGLEELYEDQVNFVILDLDKTGDNQYGPFIKALGYNPGQRPGIYILDPDGNLIQGWLGPVDGKELQQVLVDAIAKYE